MVHAYVLRGCFAVVLTALTAYSAQAQQPSWLQTAERRAAYPSTEYIVGYGISQVQAGEAPEAARDRALAAARVDASQSVRVTVASTTSYAQTETEANYFEEFAAQTVTKSELTLSNVESQAYFEQKAQLYHVLVYASRSKTLKLYQDQIAQLGPTLTAAITAADKSIEAGLVGSAYRGYLALAEDLLAYWDANQVVQALGGSPADFPVVNSFSLNQRLEKAGQTPASTLDAVAGLLVQMCQSLPRLGKNALVTSTPFAYQDSRFFSPLSRALAVALTAKLAGGVSGACTNGCTDTAVLEGSYWLSNNGQLVFTGIVKDAKTGQRLGGVSAILSAEGVASSGLEFKPQAFESAIKEQQQLADGELVESNGLTIEVWTNKGQGDQVFTEGEELRFYLRANLPCYVRMIYHLADSSQTLLLDNYYLDASKVNKVFELPEAFECSEPFGIETLRVLASSVEFPPVDTYTQDGYVFIKHIGSALQTTRGVKKKKEARTAEEWVAFTTMPKQ